jgi:deoxyribodipyrimidine photolyase-related protein
MQFYKNYLMEQGYKVEYIEATEELSDIRKLLKHLSLQRISTIHFAEVADNWLTNRLTKKCKQYNIKMVVYTTPNFLNTLEECNDFFSKKKYFQTDFYIQQRTKRRILIDANQQPIGGKWTYDIDNRKKIPSNELIPEYAFPKENRFLYDAKNYVLKNFSTSYGNTNIVYPTTFEEAENWLTNFIETRLNKFGTYEDAILAKENYLYHSVLTPILNIGLITPQQIINQIMLTASTKEIPLNSLEGFIRQVIGWREFIRAVYEREGSKQRTHNFWNFTKNIPQSFYNASTGITPVDDAIEKLLQTGYNHHIERLLILGNFMLLCEFNPNRVYQWFMEMYVDSYDWVMVPNVYGMSQFADGGLMTTKPYISGSNYILKMSNYKKDTWCEIWDALFWRFMHVHRNFFLQNPRLGMLVKTFDKMNEKKQQSHLQIAEKFLTELH